MKMVKYVIHAVPTSIVPACYSSGLDELSKGHFMEVMSGSTRLVPTFGILNQKIAGHVLFSYENIFG